VERGQAKLLQEALVTGRAAVPDGDSMATPAEDGELEALLDYVHERRNFDFRGYKRASLTRRVVKRMQAIDVDDSGAT
jgi:hypothetical protein